MRIFCNYGPKGPRNWRGIREGDITAERCVHNRLPGWLHHQRPGIHGILSAISGPQNPFPRYREDL